MDATAILAKTRMLTPRSIGTSVVNWRKRKNAQHALTDLKTLQGIVDELPLEDPCQALEQVNHWLRTLNQSTAIKPERRYAVIDKLDAATRTGQQQLLDRYVTLAPARCVEGKRIWQTMTAFWTLLGTAYLVCARQCGDSGETPIALRPPLPVLAARGMRALRYQIKWLLLRGGAIRTDLWDELRCFAVLAESAGGAAQPLDVYADCAARTSPNDEFARLVMFWSVSPSGLPPAAQDVAERLVGHFTPNFRLLPRQEKDCDFFFDLCGAHPPLRLMRTSPWSDTTRYFDAGKAWQAASAMHALFSSSGYLPPGLDLGPAAEASATGRALDHLQMRWSVALRPHAATKPQHTK